MGTNFWLVRKFWSWQVPAIQTKYDMTSPSNTNDSAAIYSAFDLLSEGIWEIQEDGQTLFGNKWLCHILGYSPVEFVKLNFIRRDSAMPN